MNDYIKNRDCSCVRCRAHSLMGAAVLVTLGVIFLIDSYHISHGGRVFPILFLVIGCMLLLQRTGSTEGHINPAWTNQMQPPMQAPPMQTPQQWTSGDVPAPPPPQPGPDDPNDQQVKP